MAFSGREFTFTKYPVTARKLTHRFPRPRRGYFIALKTRQFDFIPTIASEFCQPRNSSTPSCCTTGMTSRGVQISLSGRVAQSVTCLATDACLTANPGVASLIPVRSHTFVEIDHEIISTVILLPLLIYSRRAVVSYRRKYVHELLVNRLFKPAKEKVWLGELTIPQ